MGSAALFTMSICKVFLCSYLIFIFITLTEATTSVEFEPDGGNITIHKDRYSDIEYKVTSNDSVIGQFHQNLKTNSWENCFNCEIWYVDDTTSEPIYMAKELDSLIPINRSILEDFATHNIDKECLQ